MKEFVLIVGSNGEIGSECVKIYAEKSNNLILIISGKHKINTEFINNLKNKFNIEIVVFELNLSDNFDCPSFFDFYTREKPIIKFIVANAGILLNNFSLNTTKNQIENIFNTNYINLILFLIKVIRKIIRKGLKSIVFVSSISALDGHSGRMVYASSKSALRASALVLSKELGKENIRINTVSPGLIDSPMLFQNSDKQEINRIIESISLKRVGSPKEVANVIYFLNSDKASYINGQDIRIDGGI